MKSVARRLKPQGHKLRFLIGGSSRTTGTTSLSYQTHEELDGTRVGYDVPDIDGNRLEAFVNTYCPKVLVTQRINAIQKWAEKVGLKNLRRLDVQFALEREHGGGFLGRGVAGENSEALLTLEFVKYEAGSFVMPLDPEFPDVDVIPHELMHIKDVADGLSPSIYPFVFGPGQGSWVDVFRHLWIDGCLEKQGLPHMPKAQRMKDVEMELHECGKVLTPETKRSLEEQWGVPVSLMKAIKMGLSLGLPLQEGCSLEAWFSSQTKS